MRCLLILCTFACCLLGSAQVIENPVFDRTDTFTFRVYKVEITIDTTYVYCSYQAQEHSWANISKETYLEDINSGIRLPLLKAHGLPFSPEKRRFTDADTIQVLLCFPHIETNKFNIIENEDEESFNIYGIDYERTYTNSYTSEDIKKYFDIAQKEQERENWLSAINYSLKQLEAADYVEGIRSFPSACAMYNLMMKLILNKEYDKALQYGNKITEIINTLPKDSTILDVLSRTYGNMGTAYRGLKKIDKATDYEELSLTTRRLGDGIGALNYEEYLTHIATQYYREGNYPKALLYGKEVVEIYKAKYENNNYKYSCIYLEVLCNLCEFYKAMHQPKEAVKCGKIALKLFDEGVCDDDNSLKYWIYNNLAGALASDNQVDEALWYLDKLFLAANSNRIGIGFLDEDNIDELLIGAKSLLASIYLNDKKDTIRAEKEYEEILNVSDNYMVALENLYGINRWRNHDKAMCYLEKAIDVEKKRGIESMSYANLLLKWIRNTWVDALTQKKGIDSLLFNIQSAVDIIKRHINNTSFNLSRNERKAYWQRYQEVFTWLIPTISGILNTQETNSLTYDASLFYKGLLLSSEKNFKEVIEEEKDNSLTVLYNNYVLHISQIEELYAKRASSVVIDSLNNIIKEEEYELCQKVSRYNRQYKRTNICWKEVRDALNNQEATIEIVSYKNLRGDDIYYDAYLIGKDAEAPKLFHLCGENELKDCLSADSINYFALSNLILGNVELQKELKKYKTLYISPTGLMNSIGIEYLPIEGNKCLSDRFNIYRVSSTREVCTRRGLIKIENVCIFGGLDYDSESQEVVDHERSLFRVSRAVEEAIISRGGFEPLYGSKAEVEMIKDEMKKGRIKSILLYKGADGSEDCFKQLSGSQINILHLSTHGMFVSSDYTNLKRNNNFHFILADEDSIIDEETRSLTRSFLVMSGGNKLLKREKSQYKKEDEILTSLEISHLDFKDLDLVVLSACQTGLGEIDADGVYGLQRGFKKAGANTILMSLDRVDDEATRILMVEFYKNLISGQSKHQSLKNAQKHLRSVENGKYDNPKYWASFIMMDGLD